MGVKVSKVSGVKLVWEFSFTKKSNCRKHKQTKISPNENHELEMTLDTIDTLTPPYSPSTQKQSFPSQYANTRLCTRFSQTKNDRNTIVMPYKCRGNAYQAMGRCEDIAWCSIQYTWNKYRTGLIPVTNLWSDE